MTVELINKLHVQAEHTTSQQEVYIYGKALAILKGSNAFSKQEVINMLNSIIATGYKKELINEVIGVLNNGKK